MCQLIIASVTLLRFRIFRGLSSALTNFHAFFTYRANFLQIFNNQLHVYSFLTELASSMEMDVACR